MEMTTFLIIVSLFKGTYGLSVLLGNTAVLPCQPPPEKRTVLWLLLKENSNETKTILTDGCLTTISPRIAINGSSCRAEGIYDLKIYNVSVEDSGVYRCKFTDSSLDDVKLEVLVNKDGPFYDVSTTEYMNDTEYAYESLPLKDFALRSLYIGIAVFITLVMFLVTVGLACKVSVQSSGGTQISASSKDLWSNSGNETEETVPPSQVVYSPSAPNGTAYREFLRNNTVYSDNAVLDEISENEQNSNQRVNGYYQSLRDAESSQHFYSSTNQRVDGYYQSMRAVENSQHLYSSTAACDGDSPRPHRGTTTVSKNNDYINNSNRQDSVVYMNLIGNS